MSSATLNIILSPRRMLSAREAADYCGLPHKKFPTVCRVAPVQLTTSDHRYDMRDLDEWLDGLKGGLPNGDDEIIGKLGK